ncbi:MAG TPA: hypothetical protein VFZ83_06135 [Acidimicrobiia bacterium]|nr:hypothetical protein [Acidimicrobiia bacterium]
MSTRFADLAPGQPLGPFEVVVDQAANERYWRAAGVDHPALAAGTLYPPIAANLTILMFQQTCPDPMIQTRQRLRCHDTIHAGTPLVVTGRIGERWERRGRAFCDVEAEVRTDAGDLAWTSVVTFTPVETFS